MKSRAIYISILLSFFIVLINHAQQADLLPLKVLNPGQESPGLLPKIFAEAIVSEDLTEGGCVFSRDGTEIYYFIFDRMGKSVIMQSKMRAGRWLQPVAAEFSDTYSDVHPFFFQRQQ